MYSRYSRQLIALLVCLGVPAVSLASAVGSEPPVTEPAVKQSIDQGEKLYIVQLEGQPAIGLPGAAGRQPVASGLLAGAVKNKRYNANSGAVRTRISELKTQQNELLDKFNARSRKVYSYTHTFNGMALRLTPAEAARLRMQKSVLNIWEDRKKRVSTSSSSQFLGLLDSAQGLRAGLGLSGEDIIIGVIDSGITPGHPSVDERAQSRKKPRICRSEWGENSLLGKWLCRRFNLPGDLLFTGVPDHWQGECETGENFRAEDCNDKLIGARFYSDGFTLQDRFPMDANEFMSPADADGHGTHIASIAAGNPVRAQIFGREIGTISGIAPRARVAVYKACWLEPGAFRATCSEADLLNAIDAAVADGVDIINYAIGSLDDSLNDADDIALLRAAEKGVLAVVATGNDGPNEATMQAPATTPWVLSVAASSRSGSRTTEGIRVNAPAGVAAEYESKEASFTPTLAGRGPITTELVLVDDGTTITPEGEIGTVIDACSGLINSDEISNRIAFIQRGGCDFYDKVRVAQNAGAIAVVVFSNDQPLQVMAGSTMGINIPAVMIGQADGLLLRDRLADNEAIEVTLDKSIFINLAQTGNVMGSFSGRGPSLGGPLIASPNPSNPIAIGTGFLKPDVTAPGVQILGGQTPSVANGFRGEYYQYLSGTSQSAPQVAGLAALIKQRHPDWTPAEIKSALMTTARQDILKEVDGDAADPFDMGAGHVVPNNAVDPGLLYDTPIGDYDAFLCTAGLAGFVSITENDCAGLLAGGLDKRARDVNLPSIAVAELVASAEVTRTVRNVGSDTSFSVEIDAPDGVNVEVIPDTLNIPLGGVAPFTVRFTTNGIQGRDWLFGSYTWVSENHRVRSPFALHPAELLVTEEIFGSGASGSADVDVQFGYNGAYGTAAIGLELPCVLPDNNLTDDVCTNSTPAVVGRDPTGQYEFRDQPLPWVRRFSVQRDSAGQDFFFRVALFDELTANEDDLDLYVWDCVDTAPASGPDGICEEINPVGFSSTPGTSDEIVEDNAIRLPGSFIIDVHGFETDLAGDLLVSRFCALAWSLRPGSDAGNLTINGAPAIATSGASGQYTIDWSGLSDGLWLGGILHNQGTTPLAFSFVDINVNAFPEQDPTAFVCP